LGNVGWRGKRDASFGFCLLLRWTQCDSVSDLMHREWVGSRAWDWSGHGVRRHQWRL